MKLSYIKELLRSRKTAFTIQDMAVLFDLKRPYLRTVLGRLVARGDLIRVKRGLYLVQGKEINFLEMAGKLKQPSYVSLETVLASNGIVFQDYSQTIFSVSDNTIKMKVLGKNFEYYKLKDDILLNPLGVEIRDGVMQASIERAVCDRLYFSPGYYFDNLKKVDPDNLLRVAKIYNNQRLQKEIEKLARNIKG